MTVWDEIKQQQAEHNSVLSFLPRAWQLVEPTGDGRFRARRLVPKRKRLRPSELEHIFVSGKTASQLLVAVEKADAELKRR